MNKRQELELMMERIEAHTKYSRARLGGGNLVHLMTGSDPYCGLVNTHSINKRSRIYPTQDAVTCIRCLSSANARGGRAVENLGTQPDRVNAESDFVLDIADAGRKK